MGSNEEEGAAKRGLKESTSSARTARNTLKN
jgi:hypothetical protein